MLDLRVAIFAPLIFVAFSLAIVFGSYEVDPKDTNPEMAAMLAEYQATLRD